MKRMRMKSTKQGIALYFAVLVTGIGLTIALGIAEIYFIEHRITRGLMPSFVAFFAADSGSECGLFWHIKEKKFNYNDPPGSFTIRCNGMNRTVTHTKFGGGATPGGSGYDVYQVQPFDVPGGSCARVEVVQQFVPPTLQVCTRIRSSGQNKTCAGVVSGPVVVERTLTTHDPDTCNFQ